MSILRIRDALDARCRRRRGTEVGFTLVELVVVVAVLGLLAAVAIPKYQNITAEAKYSACSGALGGLRSGVALFYANSAVTNSGSASWPTLAELSAVGTVMMQEVPANPYAGDYGSVIVAGTTKGVVVEGDAGWAYRVATGEIWPNTDEAGENAL